jgi:hypothetical protein
MMEKVDFPANIPQIVSLQFANGKATKSQFGGEQMMFTTTDNRVMFLAPFVADKIRDLGIGARTPFKICKRETERGKVQFEVETLANARPETGATSWQSTPIPTRQMNTEASNPSNGNPVPAIPVPPAGVIPQDAKCMMAAMCAAVDAIVETQAYAQRRGLGVTFSEESVRAIGLSIYISNCKGGR